MRISPKDIRAAGVDPKAWHRYMRDPYGSRHGLAERVPGARCLGGPFDGAVLNLREPITGTLTIRVGDRVGRYVGLGRAHSSLFGAEPVRLQWVEEPTR